MQLSLISDPGSGPLILTISIPTLLISDRHCLSVRSVPAQNIMNTSINDANVGQLRSGTTTSTITMRDWPGVSAETVF